MMCSRINQRVFINVRTLLLHRPLYQTLQSSMTGASKRATQPNVQFSTCKRYLCAGPTAIDEQTHLVTDPKPKDLSGKFPQGLRSLLERTPKENVFPNFYRLSKLGRNFSAANVSVDETERILRKKLISAKGLITK